jgi:CheY-like chemotaxis protein
MPLPEAELAPREHGTGLLLSDDLLFRSRITGTAEKLGLTVHTARTGAELLRAAEQTRPACVLLDLQNPGLEIATLVRQLKAQTPPPMLVAYGSHVDAATLHQAREAGCDRVLPRSQVVEELVDALPVWLGGL